jgi:enamine deaminase RidA (YjgF/YER057c/UK114 family)
MDFTLSLTLWITAALSCANADVQKKVVNTAWWPPGSEKTAESVGIVSHGFVYMTGMMELNMTLNATMRQEVSDISDIAVAGGSRLANLVDCLVNAPKGGSAKVRKAFLAALPHGVRPALTVVELNGEYGSFFPTSATCVAALPDTSKGYPRQDLHVPGAYGVATHGLLHIEASGTLNEALHSVGELIRKGGGHGLNDLADCTVFLRDIGDGSKMRSLIHSACKGAPPALTIVQAGLEHPRSMVSLRCVASVPEGPSMSTKLVHQKDVVQLPRKFAYISGQAAHDTNGTDAFDAIERVLVPLKLSLSDVVSCLFFVSNSSRVPDLFAGFYDAFNKKHPPPPARDELEAVSECRNCAVVAKCIAAFPVGGSHSSLLV